jgi:hypothetical protein
VKRVYISESRRERERERWRGTHIQIILYILNLEMTLA